VERLSTHVQGRAVETSYSPQVIISQKCSSGNRCLCIGGVLTLELLFEHVDLDAKVAVGFEKSLYFSDG